MEITIIGKGNMGKAIGQNLEANNQVSYADSKNPVAKLGKLVILAVPYSAFDAIIEQYKDQLSGKVVVDITNPLNFDTLDELVVPADSSAAAELQKKLPQSKILKAFNTNFAATLVSAKVGDTPTTVLVAGDDQDAKQLLSNALKDSPLAVMDAGTLKHAKELESTGFLQMQLAFSKQISWNGGFGINK